ncbi:MAG: 2-oxoacid ferredoxin oxidoreductase [Desulfobacteraceae bacterium]|nr:2-oxoacid ferredoxin oxidoreductase [Desulfobacteraceae bacterium]
MEKIQFDIDNENQWCPGCGNFSILQAMKNAFIRLNLAPKDLLLVSGIGQAGKTPNFIACNMLHGLHGRALALATGAKIANNNLNIIVNSGDGDCYGEGGNHFLSAIRRNIDITLLVHNNQIYGLTKGQASPTSSLGMHTKMQTKGTTSSPFNPIATALVSGAGFVAQGFSGDLNQLSDLIIKGMNHKGFSIIDIFQPCVSFNKVNTNSWYKERVFKLVDTDHDTSDYEKALKIAHMGEDLIPTGIIYQKTGTPFNKRLDILKDKPLFEYSFAEEKINKILEKI